MDRILENLGSKKIVIVLVFSAIFVFALFFFIVSAFFQPSSPSLQPLPTPTPSKIISNPVSSQSNWKNYETDKFAISYPSSWNASPIKGKNDTGLITSPLGQNFPRVEVHAFSKDNNLTFESMTNIISSLGFKKSEAFFQGRSIIQFEKDFNEEEKVIRDIYYLFEEKNRVYEVSTRSQRDDSSSQVIINDIVSSFAVK